MKKKVRRPKPKYKVGQTVYHFEFFHNHRLTARKITKRIYQFGIWQYYAGWRLMDEPEMYKTELAALLHKKECLEGSIDFMFNRQLAAIREFNVRVQDLERQTAVHQKNMESTLSRLKTLRAKVKKIKL